MKSTTEHKARLRSESNHRTPVGRGPQILRLSMMLALTVATVASGQSYRVLKNFTGTDGSNPYAGLVLAGGILYGTTPFGGNGYVGGDEGTGVVFKVNTDGSGYTVLKTFSGIDGWNPYGALVLVGDTLYGTTSLGGSSYNPPFWGDGVVFKLNTDGSAYQVLKSFTEDDGKFPGAGLVLAGSTLYGRTSQGGNSTCGTVFKLTTDGSEFAVLLSMTNVGGTDPWPGLFLAGSTLYGTTQSGGPSDGGTVFRVNADGFGYTVLKSFTIGNARSPCGELTLAGNTLYGMTTYLGLEGYGVVFKVNTDGSGYSVLKSFSGPDGAYPTAGMVLAGNTLYGTTRFGGSGYDGYHLGDGVVFKMNTDGSGYVVLKNFTGSDGRNPHAGLVLAGGTLYGTTTYGGDFDLGVVFSLTVTPPSITTPPSTQTAEIGSLAGFWVEVTNTPPEATYYQWYFNNTNLLSCSTNCDLELTNVQFSQSGAYTVVVTNVLGAVTSSPALLNVITPVERRPVPGVKLTGETGSLLNVDYASALGPAPNWTPLWSVSLTSTSQYCFDLTLPLPPQRFFRSWQAGTPGVIPSLDLHMIPAITLTGNIGDSWRLDYINQFGPIDAWVAVDTVTLTNTSQLYFDVSCVGQPQRLYRLVQVP